MTEQGAEKQGFWEGFWELFRTSIIMQSLLAAVITATICAMYLMNREVPMELTAAWMLLLGFFFGTKIQHAIEKNGK